ncbi:MAG: hypothetical protein PHP14_02975 [Candidatus Pacebacteria bacterium]|nr:hypothetical protein [Candidatus Paceibacterota bacterium]
MDYARLEVAIDPIYQIADINIVKGTADSGYVSDLIGTNTTNVNPVDSNYLKILSDEVDNNVEVEFTFKNVKGAGIVFDKFVYNYRLLSDDGYGTFDLSVYNYSGAE